MGRSRSQGTANSNALEFFGTLKEPEQNLWTAVLAKAADDAVYSSDYDSALSAISWFESGCKDFRLVCHLAGRSHEYVYDKIKNVILKRKQKIKEHKEHVKRQMEIDLEAKRKKQYHKTYAKIWGSKNREHLKDYQKQYYLKNKGVISNAKQRKPIISPNTRTSEETLQELRWKWVY